MTAGTATAADNVVQAAIPDFYQHQGDNGPAPKPISNSPSADRIWRPDKGWCMYVSDLNALYPWETLTVFGASPYDNAQAWLFGAPGAPNPGIGANLTGVGTWVAAADDTVIPTLVAEPSINDYLNTQKVDVANLGLAGLLDTQYNVLVSGQVQVGTIAGWKNITPNTFELYQQLASAGSFLPAALPASLQQLAAITTTIGLTYTGGNNQGTTGFWWTFHQVAGAGVAGANTMRYADPDAVQINAGGNGGFTQAAVTDNQFTAAQQAGATPLPGHGAYNVGNLYDTMIVNAKGEVVGGSGPYDVGLNGAAAPVTRIEHFDAVSLPAVQIVSNVAQGAFNLVTFRFTGDFGGEVSALEIFPSAPLANPAGNYGLSQTAPGWTIATVTQDPFGNVWGSGAAGIVLQEGPGGQDLMEGAAQGNAPSYLASFNTTSAVTGWTVFAYIPQSAVWLTQTYGASAGFRNGPQLPASVPAIPIWGAGLLAAGLLGIAALVLANRSRGRRRSA
jgi:hypothetical protein